MIEGITETKEEIAEEVEIEFATITGISADGVTLKLDGEEESREKAYQCNAGVKFAVGDRVKIHKTSGTYVAEYPVGGPNTSVPEGLPSGGSDGQILKKTSNGAQWANEKTELPSGGSIGNVLKKTANGSQWAAANELPSGGSAGQVLKKTSNGAEWENEKTELPTGGSTGQVLKKTSSGVQWANEGGSAIKNGSHQVSLNTSGELLPGPNGDVDLGSAYYNFGNLYANGTISLGSTAWNSKIGFFGKAPVSRQTVSSTATLTQLINALKAYGLIG